MVKTTANMGEKDFRVVAEVEIERAFFDLVTISLTLHVEKEISCVVERE